MARQSVHMFWGVVSLVVGALFAFASMRLLVQVPWRHADAGVLWFLAGLVPSLALAIWLVWVGKRQLQRAGGQAIGRPRFRWGRFVLGLWIAVSAVKSHFSPGPKAFQPDNQTQADAMFFTAIMMTGVGVLLMALAFKPVKQAPTAEGNNPAAGTNN